VPGGLDPGQESECGTRLLRGALRKLPTSSHFQYADGQVAAPSTRNVHRSPSGNLALLPGQLRAQSSTARCCCRQDSWEVFRYFNCPG
jgi:hypothetical protein